MVDDQLANLRVLDLMVSRLGYECDCASDGLLAVERFKAGQRYAAVLMDGQMPHLDGYEAARRIRHLCAGEPLRPTIFALTAAPTDAERMKAAEAGMDDFLEKPISMSALRDKLALWVDIPHDGATPIPASALSVPPPQRMDISALRAVKGFDATVLERLARLGRESGEGVADVVVGLVLRELPQQLHAIEEALRTGDREALTRTVHRLTGAARNVGAVELADLCARAERTLHAVAGGYAQIEDGFATPIITEARRVTEVLQGLAGERP